MNVAGAVEFGNGKGVGYFRPLRPFEAFNHAKPSVRGMIATSVDDLRCTLRNAEANGHLDLEEVRAAICLIDVERKANRNATLFTAKRGLLEAALKRGEKSQRAVLTTEGTESTEAGR